MERTAMQGPQRTPPEPRHPPERPPSFVARIRLFLFRTTLGRTRKDKNEV
jgi:hypothetical protein